MWGEPFSSALVVVLWDALGLVVYAYLGYPLLLWVLATAAGRRPIPPGLVPADDLPEVSLLIAALNEEKWIGERVANALAQDYPADRLRVVVASDGSTDRTAAIVRELAERYPGRVTLHDFAQRRGKASVLNEVLPSIASPLVVLSDANTLFEPRAVRRLARWFGRDDVIAVCGRLDLVDAHTGQNVDGLYWRYENFLKHCENHLGALLGANGAVYAIRTRDYVAIPGDTIIDDFVIPLLIKLRRGGRIVYESQAVAVEETPPRVRDEFRRRARIGAGGFQSLATLWPLLLPTAGWTSLSFLSHKVLRWIAPWLLLAGFVANGLLLEHAAYRWLFGLQLAFYALACVGHFAPGRGAVARGLRLTTLFASMNAALAVGLWRWLVGTQGGAWQRTVR